MKTRDLREQVPVTSKKQQSWSCWIHLGSNEYHLNTAIPVILVAEGPVAAPAVRQLEWGKGWVGSDTGRDQRPWGSQSVASVE